MRSPARSRRIVVAVLIAVAVAALTVWIELLPQPPTLREVLTGAGLASLAAPGVILALTIRARSARQAETGMRAFLADASHELRTPIASLQASAETLLRGDPAPHRREELVARILQDTHRAGRLVDDLLSITRLDQGLPLYSARIDLMCVISDAAHHLAERAPRITVEVDGPPTCGLSGDAAGLRQVLDNLLINAQRSTSDGGRISVHLIETSGTVAVEVTDTGHGVAAADRERIFERFTRLDNRPYPGNGLGLPIARAIVRAHGGSLTCEPQAGEGARFLIRLPNPTQSRSPRRNRLVTKYHSRTAGRRAALSRPDTPKPTARRSAPPVSGQ
jgi:two-component system OmpR family sensor kinase